MEKLLEDLKKTESLKRTSTDAEYDRRRQDAISGAKTRIEDSEGFDLVKSVKTLDKIVDKGLIRKEPNDGSPDEFGSVLTSVVERERKRIADMDEMSLDKELKKVEKLEKDGYLGTKSAADELRAAYRAQDGRILRGEMNDKRAERLQREAAERRGRAEERRRRGTNRWVKWAAVGLLAVMGIMYYRAHSSDNSKATPRGTGYSAPSTQTVSVKPAEKEPSATLKTALEQSEAWRVDFNNSIKGLPEKVQADLNTGVTYVNVFAEWQHARVDGDKESQEIAEKRMSEMEAQMGKGPSADPTDNINSNPAFWAAYKYRELAMPHMDKDGDMTGEKLLFKVSPEKRIETYSNLFNKRTNALNKQIQAQEAAQQAAQY